MKKKKFDPPRNFEVEDADAAFGKLKDAARRLLASPNEKDAAVPRSRVRPKNRKK